MRKKEMVFLILSLLIFIIAVTVGSYPTTKNVSTSTTSMNQGFSGIYEGNKDKEIDITDDTELRLKIASHVKKGSLSVSIVSPDNKVVYKKEGKSFYDIQEIPVIRGIWHIKIESNHAANGKYSIKAVTKYER